MYPSEHVNLAERAEGGTGGRRPENRSEIGAETTPGDNLELDLCRAARADWDVLLAAMKRPRW
jgi:hypothetical protein